MTASPLYHFFSTHADLENHLQLLSPRVARQWSKYSEGLFRNSSREELGDEVVAVIAEISTEGAKEFMVGVSSTYKKGNHVHFFDPIDNLPRFMNGRGGPQVSTEHVTFNYALVDTAMHSGPIRTSSTCEGGRLIRQSAVEKAASLNK